MRFKLLDRIVDLKPGVSITAIKGLALAEDYLADHFPQFPVMPGVFMLEAMTQASAWLIRVSEDFRHSMVVLREARNVKYADFVAPGQTLVVTAEMLSQTENETKLKVQGSVDGKLNVGARLVLARYNLADGNPVRASSDAHVIRQMRLQFDVLYRPSDVTPAAAAINGSANNESADSEPAGNEFGSNQPCRCPIRKQEIVNLRLKPGGSNQCLHSKLKCSRKFARV